MNYSNILNGPFIHLGPEIIRIALHRGPILFVDKKFISGGTDKKDARDLTWVEAIKFEKTVDFSHKFENPFTQENNFNGTMDEIRKNFVYVLTLSNQGWKCFKQYRHQVSVDELECCFELQPYHNIMKLVRVS